MRPLIAIPGRPVPAGGVDGWPLTGAVAAPLTYLTAIKKAGGQEAILHPVPIDEAEGKELLSRFSGLLLLGGGDIDPSVYGQESAPEVYGVSQDRDSFEISLVRAAMSADIPVLAICRGIQVLNVALGGTLHQHIIVPEAKVTHGFNQQWGTHQVNIFEGSALSKVMQTTNAKCSSHHHQAVDEVADGLQISASAEDDTIEGLESADGRVIGVQWHPEMTAGQDPAQQALFDWLVLTASGK